MQEATATSARRAALGRLIDHAALFPPASMSMTDALAEDERVRSEPTGWVVNRFVVPASRLAELRDAELPLSVVLDTDTRPADRRIEAYELPPGRDLELAPVSPAEVYVELPLSDDLSGRIASLRNVGARAKVRCGGESVPAIEALAAFVALCRRREVPFKATAGLHHPVRAEGEHGFLNLLAAAVFGDEEAVLSEEDPAAFGLDDDAFRWRRRVADTTAVARIRRDLFVGVGSCSVQEPVDDLRSLGLLPG